MLITNKSYFEDYIKCSKAARLDVSIDIRIPGQNQGVKCDIGDKPLKLRVHCSELDVSLGAFACKDRESFSQLFFMAKNATSQKQIYDSKNFNDSAHRT